MTVPKKPPAFTAAEKLACAQRELAFRRSVYPNLVRKGRMTHASMCNEIDLMSAIVADYTDKAREEGALLV